MSITAGKGACKHLRKQTLALSYPPSKTREILLAFLVGIKLEQELLFSFSPYLY